MAFTKDTTLVQIAARAAKYKNNPFRFGQPFFYFAQLVKNYVDAETGGAFAPVLAGTVTSAADASSPFESSHAITGLLTTDRILATVTTRGVSVVVLLRAECLVNGTLVLQYSADPGTALTITYVVFRTTP